MYGHVEHWAKISCYLLTEAAGSCWRRMPVYHHLSFDHHLHHLHYLYTHQSNWCAKVKRMYEQSRDHTDWFSAGFQYDRPVWAEKKVKTTHLILITQSDVDSQVRLRVFTAFCQHFLCHRGVHIDMGRSRDINRSWRQESVVHVFFWQSKKL